MSMNQEFQEVSPAKLRVVAIASIIAWSVSFSAAAAEATIVGIDGSRFTMNGKPTFLLGVSYYGALGASEEFVRRDLDDVQRYGFNWLRVWATWESFGDDVSAVDSHGQPRQPFMDKLKWLVAECDPFGAKTRASHVSVGICVASRQSDKSHCLAKDRGRWLPSRNDHKSAHQLGESAFLPVPSNGSPPGTNQP